MATGFSKTLLTYVYNAFMISRCAYTDHVRYTFYPVFTQKIFLNFLSATKWNSCNALSTAFQKVLLSGYYCQSIGYNC